MPDERDDGYRPSDQIRAIREIRVQVLPLPLSLMLSLSWPSTR
jgi:hypothetical protein